VEIWIPIFLDEGQELEPEPIERTMRVLKLREGLRMTEVGFRLSTGIDYRRASSSRWTKNFEESCFLALRRF